MNKQEFDKLFKDGSVIPVNSVDIKHIPFDPIMMWFKLREYILSKDVHNKEDLVAKMSEIEFLAINHIWTVKLPEEGENDE